MNTRNRILNAQHADESAMLELIASFNPLLKKYTRRLKYEDAYNDLVADFVEIISKFPTNSLKIADEGAYVNYISASVHNAYCRRQRKVIKSKALEVSPISDLSENEKYHAESLSATQDTYFEGKAFESANSLTEREYRVLVMVYTYGLSVIETAKLLGVSRQFVNTTKSRALDKLRKDFI